MNPHSPETSASDTTSNEITAHEVAAATELSDDMIELSLAELTIFDPAELELTDLQVETVAGQPEADVVEVQAVETPPMDGQSEEPAVDHGPIAVDRESSAALPEAASRAGEPSVTASDSLETVELELALHNQNVVSLGFEESIRTALDHVGGEILFQMRVEDQNCQRVAAVRLGQGEEAEFALVIMPPGGGLMRVEPVAQSSNPLARITQSYAGLMDVFKAAA